MGDSKDQFPVGMRVLAVDDDPTCLKVLETLLRRCQYHVTVAKNAIAALKLLRENKNKFDLVISDVHMPDMDGFKLLELVGLEMDLPVIMLSVNGDPKMVMKGITHGACDYLLKPVRIEEIRNIWQHVIRRKKIDSKERNKSCNKDTPNFDICNERGETATVNSDQNEKPSKKRKDQDEDDDDEGHENGHENEDPSTQKKPRVVWSPELHRKFVEAVHQLGVDKAVPKKILDMMNVEKLTRENVASHLQKYRLYLKKYSSMANQQDNMVEALGGADSSYMRLSSLSGVGHLQTLSSSRQFHNNAFRSFPPGGMISRLNTTASLNVHGLPSSRTLQLGHAQKLNNSTNDQLKFQSAIVHGNQNGVQGMPMSMGLDQLRHNKGVGPIQNLTTLMDAKTTFPITSKLPHQRPKVTLGCSPSPVLDISKNTMKLKANPQDKQVCGVYNSQFSLPLLDNGKCNDIWSSAAMPPTNNMTTSPLQGENLSGASSIIPLSCQPLDSLTNMHSQDVIFTNTPEQISSSAPFQGWDNHNQDGSYHSLVIGSPIGSIIPLNAAVDPNYLDSLEDLVCAMINGGA